jgi:porin
VNLHGESRFGQSINGDVGSLVPANFALEFPTPVGSASALTNVQIEQFLGPDFVVTFGKLNAADGVNIHPFLGGNGINRFLNEAFVLSPLYGRLIPYSTPGAGLSYLRDFDPVFTFLVLDTNGRPDTSGLRQMFRNGATLFASLRLPVTPFGLPGHQSLEAGYTSGKFSPFSEDDYIILPGRPAPRRTGSWLVAYGFDQFLVVDPEDPTKGWGIFANISLADQATNPVHWFLNLGVGGESPLPGRAADSFGLGYYYLATSSVLRDTLRPVAPIGNEQGFELYYNAAITGWFTLTADIQAIDPAQFEARSSFLLGLRAKIDF